MATSAWDQPRVTSGREWKGNLHRWTKLERFERGERLGSCRMLCRSNILQLLALAGLAVSLYLA